MESRRCTTCAVDHRACGWADGDRDRSRRLPRALRPIRTTAHSRSRSTASSPSCAAAVSRRATGRASTAPRRSSTRRCSGSAMPASTASGLSGCFTYGSAALLAACARHGILVWQDLMFSVLDYPDGDRAFRARVRARGGAAARAAPGLALRDDHLRQRRGGAAGGDVGSRRGRAASRALPSSISPPSRGACFRT